MTQDDDKTRADGEAILRTASHWERTFDAVPDLIAIIDDQFRIVRVNKAMADRLGLRPGDCVGQTCHVAVHGLDHPPEFCPHAKLMADGREQRVEIFEVNLGGYFQVSTSPLTDADGRLLGSIHIARDITDRKQGEEDRCRLEAQIRHGQKLESLGVLAGGIAHDFNNLLVAILGNADLARDELPVNSPAHESLVEIELAARRAAELCRQMLAYSGRGRFVVEPLDLSAIVREMSHILEISTSKKAVLQYDFADALPAVEADATQMHQVVMNLITNASEAIEGKGGVISIATGTMPCDRAYLAETYLDDGLPEGLYVTLEVADNGCGMDDQTRERLFEPFFTTKFAGRGLGLAAVLGIVRGHNGAIKVSSKPGEGTTFKVLFPASDRPPVGSRDGPAAAEQWRSTGTVLLADDESAVRAVARRMLTKLGFTVLTASDGREAIDLFRSHCDEIICVICDLTMPHMDGEEAFRELRRIRSDVAVILSSGYDEQEVTQRFVGQGLAGFIQKPYKLDALVAALRDVLGG